MVAKVQAMGIGIRHEVLTLPSYRGTFEGYEKLKIDQKIINAQLCSMFAGMLMLVTPLNRKSI